MKSFRALTTLCVAATLGLSACSDDERLPIAHTLQLLHASDFEGAGPAIEDAPRFSAVLGALRATMPEKTLTLSSGDNYLPSPFYSASNDAAMAPLLGEGCGDTLVCNGRGDIAMLNAMGFQASAFGNHEFDEGTSRIADLIKPRAGAPAWAGAQFPYLSSNLDFLADANLGSAVVADGAAPQPNTIARSTTIVVDGETYGIVGATTPTLATISSPGPGVVIAPMGFGGTPSEASLDQLAATIQDAVDDLVADGVDKIILLSHMQVLDIERALATRLRHVDIIVGGGSDTILADSSDRLRAGDSASGSYPEVYTSASGEPVLLVNTDGQYRYVGRLVVGFDEDGIVIPRSVDRRVSGAYATDDAGVAALPGATPNAAVAEIAETIGEVLVGREGNLFGKTTVFLEGRAPSTPDFGVRGEETNLGNLTADANLFVAQQVDPAVTITLKNGGGIRNFIGAIEQPAGSTEPSEALLLPPQPIPAAGKEQGDISQFDIQSALSFNNGLVIVTLTVTELKALLEHGIANQPSRQGRHPQIGGMRFSYDPTLAAGSRVRSLVVVDNNGAEAGGTAETLVQNGAIVGDAGRSFKMVTLGFLQRGGDGYPFPAAVAGRCTYLTADDARPPACELADDVPALGVSFADPGSEQHATAAYLMERHPDATPFAEAETPPSGDTRIQIIGRRADTVIAP